MPRLALLLGCNALLGCTVSYSPLVRGGLHGMPDRVAKGRLEVSGTAGGWALPTALGPPTTALPPTTGGPSVAWGVSEQLVLEAGANLNLLEAAWVMGWGGVRLVRALQLDDEVRLVGDLETGAGAGVGGRVRGIHQLSRATWGVYEGLGGGLRWRWLGAFLRLRLDASASDTAPSTLWLNSLLGVEARAGQHLVFALGAGRGAYWNHDDGLVAFWTYQAQVSLLFDVKR